jgi:hypothetical protein
VFFGFVSKNVTNTTTRGGSKIAIAWAKSTSKKFKVQKESELCVEV